MVFSGFGVSENQPIRGEYIEYNNISMGGYLLLSRTNLKTLHFQNI